MFVAHPDDLRSVLALVRQHSPSHKSHWHGEDHWIRVAWMGLDLATRTPDADPLVAVLFGMFHDAARLGDGSDANHGDRGADLANRLIPQCVALEPARLNSLEDACRGHTTGHASEDPTIGVCWDADRLDLIRLGVPPRNERLSSQAAKLPAMHAYARQLMLGWPVWDDVFARLSDSTKAQ